MSEIVQYFQEEVRPDGTVVRSFTDHFGPDLDVYLCRPGGLFDSYLDHYEDPEFEEFVLDHMGDGDFDLPGDHDDHEILAIDLESVAGGIAILSKIGLEPIVIDDVDMGEEEFAEMMDQLMNRRSRA